MTPVSAPAITRPRRRRLAVILALVGASSLVALSTGPSALAGPAASHAQIVGSGSSWSANAINQWIADVTANGLQVVFTANGSASGRKDYANRTTDFAVSDIGFQGTDPATGQDDTAQGRPYAYLPVVAGGTSFPYHLEVAGQLVRNLRLSGETLAKIFTNQITMWNDPAITADNNGVGFPAIPIIPVVHSEGSGSSAQFSAYLAKQYPNDWTPFNGSDTLTEYFPHKGQAIAQSGSDGVMNYISSAAANGAIGFDEYSYALGKNYPVAKVENSAGYYNLPTQYNVAVALTQALINTDTTSPNYLLQDLHQVYVDTDPRTYPLSSYSYMIIPTGTNTQDQNETTAKRQTIADYLYYSICQGQKEMGPIGYSPLPVNLVQAGFNQISQLQKADSGVDLTNESVASCQNPTFVAGNPTANYLAQIAPAPPACDQNGQGPCTGAGNTGTVNPTGTASGPSAKTTSLPTGTTKSSASKGVTSGIRKTTAAATSGSGTSVAGTSPGTNASTSAPAGVAPAATGGTSTGGTGAAANNAAAGGAAATTGGAAAASGGTPGAAATDTGAAGDSSASDPNDTAAVVTSSTVLASDSGSSASSTLGPVAAGLLVLLVLLPAFVGRRSRRTGDSL